MVPMMRTGLMPIRFTRAPVLSSEMQFQACKFDADAYSRRSMREPCYGTVCERLLRSTRIEDTHRQNVKAFAALQW